MEQGKKEQKGGKECYHKTISMLSRRKSIDIAT